MSTFASAQLDSSDDEADTDFIPTAPKSAPNGKGSSSKRKASSHHSLNLKIVRSSKLAKRRIPKGSDDQAGDDAEGPDESSAESSSDSEDEEADGDELDEEREAKRRRLQEEEEGRKKRAREAFASFANPSPESSVKETGESSTDTGAGAGVNGLVEVRRPRQFAGETIYETVRLPADHPDAIAYFSSPHTPSTPSGTRGTADVPKGADTAAVNSPAMPAAQGARPAPEHTALPDSAVARPDSTTAAPTAPTSTTTAPIASSSNSIPPKRPPPKRKPRQSLEAMSAALDKGKKMTTLEKSQMDWQSHLSSTTGLSDELASNRKAGGYLEKRDFLERVEDRRTGAYDQIKKGRR